MNDDRMIVVHLLEQLCSTSSITREFPRQIRKIHQSINLCDPFHSVFKSDPTAVFPWTRNVIISGDPIPNIYQVRSLQCWCYFAECYIALLSTRGGTAVSQAGTPPRDCYLPQSWLLVYKQIIAQTFAYLHQLQWTWVHAGGEQHIASSVILGIVRTRLDSV